MSSLISRAASFARNAHEQIGQRRKFTDDPYIVHPEAVAAIVSSVTDDSVMIAAAWLHDVVEDTPVTIEAIMEEFGTDVGNLVRDLTNVSSVADGDRLQQKAIDRQHTSLADPRAKTIKLADLIDNLSGIAEKNPGFARIYLQEKQLHLNVLQEGDPILFLRAQEIVAAELKILDVMDQIQ